MNSTTSRIPWVPPSIAAVALVWIGWLAVFMVWPTSQTDLTFGLYAASIASAKAVAFLQASRRAELGRQLRVALRITALAFCLSVVDALSAMGTPLDLPPLPAAVVLLAGYAVGTVGILWMPRYRGGTGVALWVLPFDAVITVLGFGVMLVALVTLPQAAAVEAETIFSSRIFGVAQILMLLGLNVYVLYGRVHPSRRAFWLFGGGVLGSLITIAVHQLWPPGPTGVYPGNITHLLTAVVMLMAAHAFARDPIETDDVRPAPAWFLNFNPLPVLATLGVAALVLRSALKPGTPHIALLSAVLVPQVGLLIIRQQLTAWDNARRLALATAQEERRREERLEAVGHLAGGIAHWFNNLMTVVLGNAEIAAEEAHAPPSLHEGLHHIRVAANRAARLTRQLLSFSGRVQLSLRAERFDALLDEPTLNALVALPHGVRLRIPDAPSDVWVRVDLPQMRAAISELLANAMEASPAKPWIEVRGSVATLPAALDGAVLGVPEGTYAVIEIADQGGGIDAAHLPRIFDPFFTTKAPHQAPGLGLAAVYGILAAHGGGLMVESTEGAGTIVRVYLPVTSPADNGA